MSLHRTSTSAVQSKDRKFAKLIRMTKYFETKGSQITIEIIKNTVK